MLDRTSDGASSSGSMDQASAVVLGRRPLPAVETPGDSTSAHKHSRRHGGSIGSSDVCGLPEALWVESLRYLPGAGLAVMSVSKWMGRCYVQALGSLHASLAPAMFGDSTPLALFALSTPLPRPRHWAQRLAEAAAEAHRNDTVEAVLQAAGIRYSPALLAVALRSDNDPLALRMLDAHLRGEQDLVEYIALSTAAAAGNFDFLARCSAEGMLLSQCDGIAAAAAQAGHWDGLFRWAPLLGLAVDERTAMAAARAGNWQALQWATAQRAPTASVLAAAMEGGHLDLALQLRRSGCPWDGSAYTAALRGGDSGLLDALLAEGCPFDGDCYTEAARLGDTATLTKLDGLACPAQVSACTLAASEGHIHVLDHLLVHRPNTMRCAARSVFYAAASSGRLEVLGWALSHGLRPADADVRFACSMAARRGHVHVLRWLHTHAGGVLNASVATSAAERGSLEAVRACHELGAPLTWAVATTAARLGYPNILEYVLSSGCKVGRVELLMAALRSPEPQCRAVVEAHLGDTSRDYTHPGLLTAAMDSGDLQCMEHVLGRLEAAGTKPCAGACDAAASAGDLSALQLLRSHGYPWDAETCSAAAEGGYFALLKWARAHGCEWDERTCEGAASSGMLSMLQWARSEEQRGGPCPWDVTTTEAAARNADDTLLRWALQHGCPMDESACRAACVGGNLEVLRWLREEARCPWDWQACRQAAEHQEHEDVVDWIDNNH